MRYAYKPPFYCPHCEFVAGQSYKNKEEFESHLRRAHGSQETAEQAARKKRLQWRKDWKERTR